MGKKRRLLDEWKDSLKWQRLKPYEKFTGMIERHWDGIAAYSRPENKVSLGFVEGLNNKICVIQRMAPIMRAMRHYKSSRPILVHTGQHYEGRMVYEMKNIFD